MNKYLIIPGLGNSGPEHWQTFFEQSGHNFLRIEQEEWDEPDCSDWTARINKIASQFDPAQTILIGHSLGCVAIAHWASSYQTKIKAALLVAPSDIESPVYTFNATGFTPIPLQKILFPTLVIASENDQWVSLDRAKFFADHWGSEFMSIGAAGHINVASGYGKWDGGLALLQTLG